MLQTPGRNQVRWDKGRGEEVGCFGSWSANFFLPLSGGELQTVRKSHVAVYLHFSISSHSSSQRTLRINTDIGWSSFLVGLLCLPAVTREVPCLGFFNYTNSRALLRWGADCKRVGSKAYTTPCAKSTSKDVRQKDAEIRLNAVLHMGIWKHLLTC